MGARPLKIRWISDCWIRRRWVLPVCIALVGLLLNIIVATYMAPCADESVHVYYAMQILKGNADRSQDIYFNSKMPVSLLNAIPRLINERLREKGKYPGLADRLDDFRAARYTTVFAALVLCLLVYRYAEALYGRLAGLFAQLLFIIAPNITAHSTLATSDLYFGLAVIWFLYAFRLFLLQPSFRNALWTSVSLTFAQLTKAFALYLYLVLGIFLLAHWWYSRRHPGCCDRIPLRKIGLLLGLHVLVFVAALNLSFRFDRTFTPLAGYHFQSPPFRSVQRLMLVRDLPLPLPYPYLQGLDMLCDRNATQKTHGNIALLGRVRGPQLERSDGFALYYLVAYLFKEPLGMQLLLLLSLAWRIRHSQKRGTILGELLLLTAACMLSLMLSFFNTTQIGISHILPVLAIFMIISGAVFADWAKYSWRWRSVLGGCILWAAISAGSYFPYMIPYFNELLVDRKMAYRILADSNLDWGQAYWVVQDFLKKNPDVTLNPEEPTSGRILASANLMAGVGPWKADYWLRRWSLKPVAHVGYAFLLFDVSPDLLNRNCAKE